jgi:hypothetical protein
VEQELLSNTSVELPWRFKDASAAKALEAYDITASDADDADRG